MEFESVQEIDKTFVYFGNVYRVNDIDNDLLIKFRKTPNIIIDYSNICDIEFVKESIFIKIGKNIFVDVEDIMKDDISIKDIVKSNKVIRYGVTDPYVGQLFIKEVKPVNIKGTKTDIKTLKMMVQKKNAQI